MAGYQYSDPFEGLIKGHDYVTGLFDQHARLQAGKAVATGDLTGASGLLASRGMLGEAQKLRDQQTSQTALTAYDAGDTAGALTAAAKGGDATLYGSLDSAQSKDQAERAQWLGHAADALLQIPDEAQRHAAFASSIAPVMKSMGVPEDQIAMIGNGQLTNENLTAFKATLGQVSSMSIQTTPDGDVIGIDPKTGAVKVLHHSEAKPIPSTGGAWVQDGGKWVFKQAPRTEKLGAGDTLVGISGDGDGTAGTTGTPSGGSVGQGGFDAIYGTFVAPQEGGYTASDGNGAPANFGINQKANPDIDVKSLTAEAARKIMHDRYWQPSGAEGLPPALQAIQFDTAVNMGVGAARELLQQSGGDPEKYIQLREARYKAIAARDPSKQSRLPNWLSRNAALRSYALGGGEQGAAGDGVRVLARGAPKPGYRPSTPEEVASVGLPPGTPAQTSPEGKIEPLPGQAVNLKPIPGAVGRAMADTKTAMSKIDRAIETVNAYPQGLGLMNVMGDAIRQRTDPGGVDVRAAVADIGSQIIHDRSGAAVTVAETPRLLPFIPNVNDTPDTVIKKLKRLRGVLASDLANTQIEFGPDSGYRQTGGDTPPSATPKRRGGYPVFTPEEAATAAKSPGNKGKKFYGADGVLRTFH